jgi:cytidylate kinase
MTSDNQIIAIDGPAGSGKSSTAKALAKKLQFRYLDTGAMYRGATYYCMQNEVPLEDELSVYLAIHQMADEKSLEIALTAEDFYLKIMQMNVTKAIRTPDVSKNVHFISSNLKARKIIVDMQKDLISLYQEDGIVVEGRDATDVLASNAVLKVLLTASDEVRAKRRSHDLGISPEEVLKMIRHRDSKDSEVNNFTNALAGVTLVDNSELTFEGTVDLIIELFKKEITNSVA